MTGTPQDFLAAVMSVACPRCGVGQQEECISRTGETRYPAGESHTARVEMAKRLNPRDDEES